MEPSSIIGPLWDMTKSLCGCIKKEASYVYDLEKYLQTLEEKSENLERIKQDVEALVEEEEISREMERSHQVSGWLKRVESIQQEIKDIPLRESNQIENKCLSKCCPKHCMSSYKLGKNVFKILRNVVELESEGERFCKDLKIAHKHRCKPNEMPLGETVGLDFIFDKVWKSIQEKDVGIIGLYGMGGVGKTTLLKKINNELGKRSDFCIIWAAVSKSPDLDSVMDCIRKRVGIADDIWENCGNQDEKAAKIYRVLKKEKFVLLLDDIWERLDLEKLGVPQPKETKFRSKVIFTTRLKDVSEKMGSQRALEVEPLPEKEALKLFHMRVGDETLISDRVIPKIAEKMAKECKGLPLALTVVGTAMAGVKDVDAWELSKKNLTSSSWTSSSLETDVFPILKFSYDRLPDETHKECFLYCALYPEDYEIVVIDLIHKWIGEGFLYKDRIRSVQDMQRYGRSIIFKLKLSCMVEMVEDDIFLKRSIKMHDVIRDMALWIARDQDKNKKIIVQEDAERLCEGNTEEWEMVERISIMKFVEFHVRSIVWTNLKTLLLKFNSHCIEIINGLQNIQYARQLKVLELEGVLDVPLEEIGGLNLLEHLSLKGFHPIDASDISTKLKNLKNLEVFHLFCFDIPAGLIPNLQQLKVFTLSLPSGYVSRERNEKKILEEVECSSKLEELWVNITTKSGVDKLLTLNKLQSCLYSLKLSYVNAPINGQFLLLAMSKMKNLHCIDYWMLQNVIDPSVDDTCRLSTLRIVSIVDCHTIYHLTWLRNAPCLEELHVENCFSIEEMIKGEILENEKDAIFPSLVVLDLGDLLNLRCIHERLLSFPSLRSIRVWRCRNLKKLPFDSNSGNAKLKHITGDQEWWDNLEWGDPATKATFVPKFQVEL